MINIPFYCIGGDHKLMKTKVISKFLLSFIMLSLFPISRPVQGAGAFGDCEQMFSCLTRCGDGVAIMSPDTNYGMYSGDGFRSSNRGHDAAATDKNLSMNDQCKCIYKDQIKKEFEAKCSR